MKLQDGAARIKYAASPMISIGEAAFYIALMRFTYDSQLIFREIFPEMRLLHQALIQSDDIIKTCILWITRCTGICYRRLSQELNIFILSDLL